MHIQDSSLWSFRRGAIDRMSFSCSFGESCRFKTEEAELMEGGIIEHLRSSNYQPRRGAADVAEL